MLSPHYLSTDNLAQRKKQVNLTFTLLQHINVCKSQWKRWQDMWEKNPRGRSCKGVFYLVIPHTIVASQSFMPYVILPKSLAPTTTETKTSFPQERGSPLSALAIVCKRFISPRQILRTTLAETHCYRLYFVNQDPKLS